jgi:hypothetical protein
MEVAIPPGSMPSPTPGVLGSSSPGWAANSRPDLHPSGSVLGSTPHPALGIPYGASTPGLGPGGMSALLGSSPSHPSMTHGLQHGSLVQSSSAPHVLGGHVPTPHPSFGGVPVTSAVSSGNGGRKAAVALGAGIIAVAIGVVGFVLTRPTPATPPPAAAQGPSPVVDPGGAAPVVEAPTPPVDAPVASASAAATAEPTAAPSASAASPPASATPATPRPPIGSPGPRAPKPKKDVLGY